MKEKIYQNERDKREIPEKKDPGKVYPEKSPDILPGAEPGKDNPRNPKEDMLRC